MKKSVYSILGFGIALSISFWIPPAIAQANKELYELQERCGKRAAEWTHGPVVVKGEYAASSYQNHYNLQLNRCFVLRELITRSTRSVTLTDVNENNVYGHFNQEGGKILTCHVQQKNCQSLTEFKELTKPYMTEGEATSAKGVAEDVVSNIETARQVARQFDMNYTKNGITGVNADIDACYKKAKGVSQISRVEHCYVIDILASIVDAAFFASVHRSQPHDSRNTMEAARARADNVLRDFIIEDVDRQRIINEWSTLASIASEELTGN